MSDGLSRRRAFARWAAGSLAVVALAVLVGPSCSDSGGNPATTLCIGFTPAASPAAGRVAAQESASTTCDILSVNLIVTDVAGLVGADMTFTYDDALVDFVSASVLGSVLGDSAELTVSEPTSGTVVAGVAILRPAPPVDVTGAGQLLRLTFVRRAVADSAPLAFTSAVLFADGTPPSPIPGITWSGGTIRVIAS